MLSRSYTYDLTHTLQYNLIQRARERNDSDPETTDGTTCWATRYQPTWKYVWNAHLQEPIRSQVHPRWLLWLVHGTTVECGRVLSSTHRIDSGVILQYNLNVFCRSIYLTLICRRSQRFSGTRFLKRGGNCRVGKSTRSAESPLRTTSLSLGLCGQ